MNLNGIFICARSISSIHGLGLTESTPVNVHGNCQLVCFVVYFIYGAVKECLHDGKDFRELWARTYLVKHLMWSSFRIMEIYLAFMFIQL